MTTCTMPACPFPPTTTNRAQQPTCREHVLVVVSPSFVRDRHSDGSGE